VAVSLAVAARRSQLVAFAWDGVSLGEHQKAQAAAKLLWVSASTTTAEPNCLPVGLASDGESRTNMIKNSPKHETHDI
jgi:hypothetical protein